MTQVNALSRLPKPKEHGAWVMLYVSFFTAVGVTGIFDLKVWLLLATVTLLFFSQQPLRQILGQRLRGNLGQRCPLFCWLGFYWISSTVLLADLYFNYRLVRLPFFAVMTAPVVFLLIYQWRRNCVRTIAGELVGILGLTMTAPLVHYVATGQIGVTGFVLWALTFVYFSSSIFYIKARREKFLKSRLKPVAGKAPMTLVSSFYHWGLLTAIAIAVVFNLLSPIVLVAFSPVILRGVWRFREVPSKLNLKSIGLMEVAYSIFFGLITIWAMRAGALAR